MASHSHFLIDALAYLADADRSPQPAPDKRAAVATRTRRAGVAQPERRHPILLLAIALLVAALLLLVPVAANAGPGAALRPDPHTAAGPIASAGQPSAAGHADDWMVTLVVTGVVAAAIVTGRTRQAPRIATSELVVGERQPAVRAAHLASSAVLRDRATAGAPQFVAARLMRESANANDPARPYWDE
jgi:hypothetical protein